MESSKTKWGKFRKFLYEKKIPELSEQEADWRDETEWSNTALNDVTKP